MATCGRVHKMNWGGVDEPLKSVVGLAVVVGLADQQVILRGHEHLALFCTGFNRFLIFLLLFSFKFIYFLMWCTKRPATL